MSITAKPIDPMMVLRRTRAASGVLTYEAVDPLRGVESGLTKFERTTHMLGYELGLVAEDLCACHDKFGRMVHRANVPMVQVIANEFGREMRVDNCPADYDPTGSWCMVSFERVKPEPGQWAADVLNRHRHNDVGTWVYSDGRVKQVFNGAEVAVLTVDEAVFVASGYEGQP